MLWEAGSDAADGHQGRWDTDRSELLASRQQVTQPKVDTQPGPVREPYSAL